MISHFRSSQIVGINSSVWIENLGEANLKLRSLVSGQHMLHAGKVLPEVVDKNAGLRFSERCGLQSTLHANGWKVLRLNLHGLRFNQVRVMPCDDDRGNSLFRNGSFTELRLAVVDFRLNDF